MFVLKVRICTKEIKLGIKGCMIWEKSSWNMDQMPRESMMEIKEAKRNEKREVSKKKFLFGTPFRVKVDQERGK